MDKEKRRERILKVAKKVTKDFDLNKFLDKEGITLYRFCKTSKTPESSLFRMIAGTRTISAEYFDKMMERYDDNKNIN